MRRFLVVPALLLAATSLLPAASITATSRFVSATGEVLDYHPENSDTASAREATTSGGSFNKSVEAVTVANDNFGSASAAQHTAINLTTREFSGSGSASAATDTEFDSADFLDESFIDARSQSQFEFTFTISRSGRVRLNTMLSASATGNINRSSARAHLWIVDAKTGASVWSTTVTQGASAFNGDIPVRKGTYRFGVLADAAMSDSGFLPNSATGAATYSVTGQVIE